MLIWSLGGCIYHRVGWRPGKVYTSGPTTQGYKRVSTIQYYTRTSQSVLKSLYYNISSIFSNNSEAFASELLENIEEMFS